MATLVRFWNDQSLKWDASSRWSSSLYCLMRKDDMTFEITHPTLPVLFRTGVRLHKVLFCIFFALMEWLIAQLVIGKAKNITIFWLCFNLRLPNGTKTRTDPKFSPFGPNQIKIRTCTVALFVLGTARKRI